MGLLRATVFAAATLGIVTHLSTLHVELDFKIWLLIECYATAVLCFLIVQLTVYDLGLQSALAMTIYSAASFNAGFFSSMISYRLFFHRLRKFPGPFWAKISRFYLVYLSAKMQQLFLDLEGFHRVHGDVVRTGPRDLSICRASAVQAIYSAQSKCLKSNWYGEPTDRRKSLQTTRDPEQHKRRRKTWDQAFSIKALASYQARVQSKVELLLAQLAQREYQPVNVSDWAMFFAFDVMGDLGFGKDFHMLEKGEEDEATKGIHKSMTAFGILQHVIWFLHWMITIPDLGGAVNKFRSWCETQVVEKQQNWDPEATPTDVFSWLLKADTVRDESSGQWRMASSVAMAEDSKLVIIAGSDTTSAAVSCALYYLTLHPHIYRNLQSQLDSLIQSSSPPDSSWYYEKVKSLPYLKAIIAETLRLKPPAISGISRVTPPHGLWIDEIFIPGDINVSVPTYAIHRDVRYWGEDAHKFWPERWLANDTGAFDANVGGYAYIPFSIGSYSCVGKELAMIELRSVLSMIALRFDLAFAPGETGEEFEKGAKDTFTLKPGDLRLVFTGRAQ